MNDFELRLLERGVKALERIAERLSMSDTVSPNYRATLKEYRSFDWESISAKVISSDNDGPTRVQWNGNVFMRRSPANKFEPAIWYSRASGHTEDGKTDYAVLVTFKDSKDPDTLNQDVLKELAKYPVKPPAPAPAPQPTQPTQPAPDATTRPPWNPAPPAPEPTPEEEPMNMIEVLEFINDTASKYQTTPITPGKRGLIAPVLEGCFPGLKVSEQKLARAKVQKYLTGHEHLTEIPDNYAIALYKWLDPREVTNEFNRKVWTASKMAAAEAMRIFMEG